MPKDERPGRAEVDPMAEGGRGALALALVLWKLVESVLRCNFGLPTGTEDFASSSGTSGCMSSNFRSSGRSSSESGLGLPLASSIRVLACTAI